MKTEELAETIVRLQTRLEELQAQYKALPTPVTLSRIRATHEHIQQVFRQAEIEGKGEER